MIDWRTKDEALFTEEDMRERIASLQKRIEEPTPQHYEAAEKKRNRDAKLVARREALSMRLARKLCEGRRF